MYLACIGTYQVLRDQTAGLPANAADTAIGIVIICRDVLPDVLLRNPVNLVNYITSYSSVCLALNILLTFMIVVRLVLHNRDIQRAMGVPAATNGLYKAIVTMLIESCALYAVALLLYLALDATNNPATFLFSLLGTGAQVRDVFIFF